MGGRVSVMRCDAVREYLFAYLDNELSVPLSIELQHHLEVCHDCSRDAGIEWTIKRRLGQTLQTAQLVAPFDDRTLREIGGQTGIRRRGSIEKFRHLSLPAAVAATVVLALFIWFRQPGETAIVGPNRLASLIVHDFQHFLEKGRPLQIASADRQSVSDWLRDGTKLNVILPAPDHPVCRLIGGRRCRINGRSAAFAIYDIDGAAAALVIVEAVRTALDGMQHVGDPAPAHWVDRCEGHTVVACRRDSLVYAAVSTVPEQELLCLIADTRHASDSRRSER